MEKERRKSKSARRRYSISLHAGKGRKIDLDPPVYKLSETSAPFSSFPSSPSAPKVVFFWGVARPPCFALLSPRSPLIFRCHKQRLGCQKGKEKWAKGEKRKE